MLSLRLQRAQRELHAHRSWLNAFKGRGSGLRTTSFQSSISRTFSGTPDCNEQKQYIRKARTPWQKKQKRNLDRKQSVGLEALSVREQLLEAVKDYDIKQVIELYSSLPEKKPLTPEDLTSLAQCVHQCFRLETYKTAKTKEREDTDRIVAFAEQLVKDIRKERLLPSLYAHVHLLGTFKEAGARDAGIRFWQWLQEQDEEFVNLDVYAVAIDLLARNGSPLEELEQLYQDALARFPGTFFAYHLSPEAILQDREGHFTVKGIPMTLLLSITLARLLGGDSQKAYLALDTALRLYPSAVSARFFAAFKDERPVSEYFTVFAIACRAGIELPLAYYKELIMRLRKSSSQKSVHNHMAVIKAMLAATRLHLGAGGRLPQNTVNEIAITITHILRLPGIQGLEAKERHKIVDDVLAMVKKMFELFARYGALPGEAVFNSMITHIGGLGRVKNAIGIALADMKALGIEPTEITRRAVISAAGVLADADLVKKSWQDIVDLRKQDQMYPDAIDFTVFVKAARQAAIDDFAREQFDLMKDHISETSHAGIEALFEKPLEDLLLSDRQLPSATGQLSAGIESLNQDIDSLDLATKDRPHVQDFSGQSLPMVLIAAPKWLQLPDEEMRKVYDDLTTEHNSSTASAESSTRSVETSSDSIEGDKSRSTTSTDTSPTPTSRTNIPYHTLRYQNWKAINYLLWLSAKHDQEHNAAVDEAIAAEVAPPPREMGFSEQEFDEVRPQSFGDTSRGFRKGSPVLDTLLHQAKNEILRLRGRTTS